ncbi:MAG: hypothetical protein U0167_14180 [bacterium]
MEDDPYGFAYHLERAAVKVMNRASRAAFARRVRRRFDGKAASTTEKPFDAQYPRRRWGEVLRAIHAAQKDVAAYVAVCEETGITAEDCLAIATLLRARKPEDALRWVERGVELDKMLARGSMAAYDLGELKRDLLVKLGRAGDAREDAWAEFCSHPGKYTYDDLMRHVPKAERATWHTRAMDASAGAGLDTLIELWLETKEIDHLVDRLNRANDGELQALSHYTAQPAAEQLAKSHPAVAARVFRALGIRILSAKKSKYYDAALSHLESAKECCARAGLDTQWKAVAAEVRDAHHRKLGFMARFERLVAGHGPSAEPSLLERAKSRWSSRGVR